MGQPFDRSIIDTHFWIDQINMGERARIGGRNVEQQRLDQHRLAATGRAGDQCVWLMCLASTKGAAKVQIKNVAVEFLQAQHEGGVHAGGVAIECTARPHIPKRDDLALRSCDPDYDLARSEGHTSELQSIMRISYAVLCLKQ